MKLPPIIRTISAQLRAQDSKAIVVGGSVRDHFLGLPIKDYDVEVYGLDSMEELEEILAQHGSVNLVGKSFGVLKFVYEGEEYDFSFPRSETKTGRGHKGFDISVDGSLGFDMASKRRDFTLNAIGYDVEQKEFIDPFGGLDDIKNKQLCHIDDETFIEDPLRVYRAVQFAARFGYVLAPKTMDLCRQMVTDGMLDELPKERVYAEWQKLLLKAPKPSLGFELMRELGILHRYFPELHALIGVPQSPIWHPEGDVWVHTMMCVDQMKKMLDKHSHMDEKEKLKFMFAILSHDLGKATTTTIEEDGRIRSIGHEIAGLEPTESLMLGLTNEHDFIQSLLPLVEHHLKPSQFYANKAKAPAIRRLATKVNISDLVLLAKADFLGRATKESGEGVYHAGSWLLEKSSELQVEQKALENLLQGRDLIDLGVEPSPQFRVILDDVYEQMLQGNLTTHDEALEYVKQKYN